MKQLLRGRFFLPDYQKILYNQFEYYQQDHGLLRHIQRNSIDYHHAMIYP